MSTTNSFALNISDDPTIQSGFNDWYLDQTGNIARVGNNGNNPADLIQTVRTAIWMWLGEYEYNTALGVNYLDIFGVTNEDDSFITLQLSNAIMSANTSLNADQLAIYGINQILSIVYTVNKANRALSVTASVILNNAQQLLVTA